MTNTIYRDVELVPQTDPETATDDTNTTVHAKPPNKCRNFITLALKFLIEMNKYEVIEFNPEK